MNSFRMFFSIFHALLALLFVGTAVVLVIIAVRVGYSTMWSTPPDASQGMIEAIGLLAVAVVSLQIAQTIVEEEVIRDAHVSAPTRVRRFLSRFLVVVVVALAIEGLVATFKALHEELGMLMQAAAIVVAVGVLLAGWGVFIRFNRSAEDLEPEAMEQAKQEDRKLE